MKINNVLKPFSLPKFFKAIAIVTGALIIIFHAAFVWVEIESRALKYIIKPGPMPVVTTLVTSETVPVYLNYVGTTASMRTVDIRARVEGFLTVMNFVEGDDVKVSDLMYIIDPQPFQAALDEAKAQLAKDEAAYAFAKREVDRYRSLVEKDYITREQFDEYITNADKAQAIVEADKANVENASLNLGYCTMYSPLDGRVSKTEIHVGNLVGAGKDTLLTTVVQLDPIYVYFSPSDQDYRQIIDQQKDTGLPVKISFSDGTKYPNEGKVDFINNVVDPTTSTVVMRAVVPNPEKKLLPGIYVNVQLLVGEMKDALLVPEQAIQAEQEGDTVFVVDNNNVVDQRVVETANTIEGKRVIKKGLSVGEKVITDGLKKVRSGMKVKAN